ncbi:MAG: D-alanyl-D-alanine carboxypeptidase [Treponema sp.]|jgi:D-alanyl-D-alanine carboxypeptidase (penicillin-binding protein 5/6)|nr:D-alanyl-D-alanine carboxypeptidase [Treponema sp.]
MQFIRRSFSLIYIFLTVLLAAQTRTADPPVEPPDLGSRSACLLDAATGTIIYTKNPDEPIPPASLTKLMTMHLALTEVEAGRAFLDEIVVLDQTSWAINQPPRSSLMFLAQGQTVSLRELLLGLAVPSGNDAAVAVALRFAPTVEYFAEAMTREARRMGLGLTRFREPSGISEYNITTAREFALFCREYLILHPETLKNYHSVAEFDYPKAFNVPEPCRNRPGTIVQYNRNPLLGIVEGVDGLKTGYIDEAGYNIALTAERRGTRFIAVILGAPPGPQGERIRAGDGRALLDWAFDHYKTIRPETGELPPVRIWKGKTRQGRIIPGAALEFTALTSRGKGLRWETETDDPLIAPLSAESPAGRLIFYDDAGELRRIPLVIGEDIEAGGFFRRLWDSIRLFFKRKS